MLYAAPAKKRTIREVEISGQEVILRSEAGLHRIVPMNERILRVTYTTKEAFSEVEKPGVICMPEEVQLTVSEQEEKIIISTTCLTLKIDRETGSYAFYDAAGKLYLAEREWDSKVLEEFTSYRLAEDGQARTEKIQTADGVKEVVRDAARVEDQKLYHTRLHLVFQEDEALYGLGQQEEGLLNLRGQTVYVHQANRKIAVPMLVSSKNYGILMDTYSPMIFNDTIYGSYLYTEADQELDYYFIGGEDMHDVVRGYRFLTGKAAMLPKWAFGYLQSQERYETADEILHVAEEYRKRSIGLDALVLDWISWEDGKWGQKTFDRSRFPDPKEMIRKLHEQNVHFMISIWPTMSENTENYAEMKAANAFLPASNIYNALTPEARALYWKQVKEGLYDQGVDSWWCDSSEPLTVEWTRMERMEPGTLFSEYVKELNNHLPGWQTNAYPYYHARTIYEGQRSVTDQKRVCNLTRSAYTGSQRLGTILWSGDTAASWKTLREQIANGLNFCASGLPYWTTDIGAFFVKKSNFWYWDGDYDQTTDDAGYLELFTRWYQWGAFLPVFRGHGTDCRRELWYFKGQDGRFYNAMVKINALRYRLMPYIYSQAGKVWLEDASLMRMLAFDFPEDPNVLSIADQYMFGDSIMVCPVTEPMYYEKNSRPIENSALIRRVYLPSGWYWYDFWTNQKYAGGQWIDVDAPIDKIPLFVKEGSILPMAEFMDHVTAKEEITYVVYSGRDAVYELYQDDGDGYAYEKGEYLINRLIWDEEKKILCMNGKLMNAEIIQ